MAPTAIDETKLEAFMGQFVQDLGAALSVATVMIGDKLGLCKAMADGNPVTPRELAERTGTDERYVREWLSSQAASGYATYDPATERFALPAEQALAPREQLDPRKHRSTSCSRHAPDDAVRRRHTAAHHNPPLRAKDRSECSTPLWPTQRGPVRCARENRRRRP